MGRNRRKATAAEQIQAIYEKEAEVRNSGTAQIAENRGRKMETPRSDGPIGEERRVSSVSGGGRKKSMKPAAAALSLLLCITTFFSGCSGAAGGNEKTAADSPAVETGSQSSGVLSLGGSPENAVISEKNIPDYTGEAFAEVNDNLPAFTEADFAETSSFETYSELDSLGRCGTAFANIGRDLMPTEERGSIGQVKPSGWQTVKYDCVDGKYLYNRCHLIGFQLTAENANRQNLITGTRYFNVEGMLPFENLTADYIKETGGHVLYRVTPVYEGDNLVASGVQMEACSVEDRGESVCFNVFVFNVQPGIVINYADGTSRLASDSGSSGQDSGFVSDTAVRGNSRSKIYHCPGQRAYEDMADSKYLVVFGSEKEAQDAGYRKAKN